jgi:hypothetical protein
MLTNCSRQIVQKVSKKCPSNDLPRNMFKMQVVDIKQAASHGFEPDKVIQSHLCYRYTTRQSLDKLETGELRPRRWPALSKRKARRIGYFRSGQSQPFGALSACSRQAGRSSLRRGKAGFFDRLNHGTDSSPVADGAPRESTRVSLPDSDV